MGVDSARRGIEKTMINQFALNKALLDKLDDITELEIAVDGNNFKPEVDQDYIAEKEVPTSNSIPLGAGKEVQRGFYQVNICTPLTKKKFYNLALVDQIRPQFERGLSAGIEFNGQKVSIQTIDASGMYNDDTHLKTALTINYTVIA